MNNALSFQKFILERFPDFVIDEQCNEIVCRMNHLAWKDSAFEKNIPKDWIFGTEKEPVQDFLFKEKGVCIIGPVGTGKTELMRIYNHYLNYIRSPYYYRTAKVWHIAELVKEKGMEAFSAIKNGNWYFDDLCMLDEETGRPTKEICYRFKNEYLAGQEIIRIRYEIFKSHGYETHFTTNASPKQLKEIYGQREFDRLCEMSNILLYAGRSRRRNARPTFYNNIVTPAEVSTPQTDKDAEIEIKKHLSDKFDNYRILRDIKIIKPYDYNMLTMYGVVLLSMDDIMNGMYKQVKEQRKSKWEKVVPVTKRESTIKKQYMSDKIDADETADIVSECKVSIIAQYFEKLIAAGQELTFPTV